LNLIEKQSLWIVSTLCIVGFFKSLPAENAATTASIDLSQNLSSSEQKIYTPELKSRAEKVGLSGNWIKKLGWLKEAVEYEGEVLAIQKEILTLRQQTYEPKIQKINDALSQFKASTKGGKGGFNSAISSLQDEIDERLNQLVDVTKIVDASDLPQEARYKIFEADDKIAEYKDKLARLKMQVGFIEDLQKAFENRVATLDGYISKANEIASTAENKVKEIFSVFDHEKARDLTFYIKGLSDNMKKMLQYVKEDALSAFDSEQIALSKEIEKLTNNTSQIRSDFTKTSAEVTAVQQQLQASGNIAMSNQSSGLKAENTVNTPPKESPKTALKQETPFIALGKIWNFIKSILFFWA